MGRMNACGEWGERERESEGEGGFCFVVLLRETGGVSFWCF